MPPELARLLLIIEEKLAWGPASEWQTRDFDHLQDILFEKTGVSLSNSTLRRVWGRVSYDHMPSMVTLNALAVFAGFDSWRAYHVVRETTQLTVIEEEILFPNPSPAKKRRMPTLILIGGLILAGLVYFIVVLRPISVRSAQNFSLSSRRITDKIPNSVVFTYDATSANVDSVFIQQSWDRRTRTSVPKDRHTFTCQYYEPGFFHAKLFAGSQLVKEDTVMIPTHGWSGMIRQFPIPVYLDQAEYYSNDQLDFPEAGFEKKGLSTQSPLPLTVFANVGNIERVPLNDFKFHAELRNGYKKGTGICQTSYIGLVTDSAPIFIPLSNPGCISDLQLTIEDKDISGKLADLSGFGTDMSAWVSVDCVSSAIGMDFFVNGKKAYSAAPARSHSRILGFVFMFRGTGSVKNIDLSSRNKSVFSAFGSAASIVNQVDKR